MESIKKIVTKNRIFLVLFFSVLVVATYFFLSNDSVNVKTESRVLMEVAEQIVREEKPTPPQSSRFYALVAKDYYNTTYFLKQKYSYSSSSLINILGKIVAEDGQEIVIKERLFGESYWVSKEKPFSPNAGKGERFIIDKNFTYKTPPPPLYGSDEFKKELFLVNEASENRTSDQVSAINFWGGVPGTEAPAGIWQNRLYDVTKKYHLNDERYAYVQMILAEAVADSFMECWKVKYTYWTKRPDMTDKELQTSMPNPPFPGYVSGHATISFTAATVLSTFFPKEKDIFMGDALEAKNSRLWAGIHFRYDNDEGEKLGTAVAEYVVKKLELQKIK